MPSVSFRVLLPVALVLIVAGWMPLSRPAAPADDTCALFRDTDPPAYYKIELVPTGRIPGTRQADGVGHVSFAPSPFGIALAPDGSYVYDLSIAIDRLRPAPQGVYVAWVSTPNLDQVKRLGVLGDDGRIRGRVDWNKFLVIITNEPSAEALGDGWQGPVVLRGLSRSGLMHTMAGHGPFQQEPCATYGY